MGGVVAVFSQVQPPDPCFLLSFYVISKVAFHPFVDYFGLAVCLRVIVGAKGQCRAN
jgi:hypothetical protein